MFKIELRPFARNAVDELLHSQLVFGVSSLQNQFDRELGGGFVFKYSKGFGRGVNLAGGDIPAKTARVT